MDSREIKAINLKEMVIINHKIRDIAIKITVYTIIIKFQNRSNISHTSNKLTMWFMVES